MPKEFYTERDIEDMVKRGTQSLTINDNVVLTDMAYEKAKLLGLRLLRDRPEYPAASPVRSFPTPDQPNPGQPAALASAPNGNPPARVDGSELRQRIHSTVIARLGNQVDSHLLDVIITRVLQSTGIQ